MECSGMPAALGIVDSESIDVDRLPPQIRIKSWTAPDSQVPRSHLPHNGCLAERT